MGRKCTVGGEIKHGGSVKCYKLAKCKLQIYIHLFKTLEWHKPNIKAWWNDNNNI